MKLGLVNARLTAGASAENVSALQSAVTPWRGTLGPDDLVVLPEHHYFGDWDAYRAEMQRLASWLGCTLVAGSAHRPEGEHRVNSGLVLSATGDVITSYDKLRPYAKERGWVVPGQSLGSFELGGRRVSVMICADFWFTDLFLSQRELPDLVVVPALSVTRKPDARYSKQLWRHTAVARAFEYGIFVGISDWSEDSDLFGERVSGVSGFADPTQIDAERLFREVDTTALIDLDFGRLDAFREDRRGRGFFWEGPEI